MSLQLEAEFQSGYTLHHELTARVILPRRPLRSIYEFPLIGLSQTKPREGVWMWLDFRGTSDNKRVTMFLKCVRDF
jgi:hypothetical protein